ncbi:MAG: hypothetical protein V2I43_17940 [Parvularcula sp.]|jgi:hypothetical protein|nr:hypothetical protein [Parvularcula sp.]
MPILSVLLLLGVSATAQEETSSRIPPFVWNPKGEPSFFVTSVGRLGGDLGGLAGADAHCRSLAEKAGLENRDWRAYLSTQSQNERKTVNARDRIGKGPWFNVERVMIARDLAHLHGDTVALAREGNLVSQSSALTELGERVGGKGDPELRHDILTGSTATGHAFPLKDTYDRTCRNWTYSGPDGSAQVGHSDRDTVGLSISWNAAHQTVGCGMEQLRATGGDGLFYCFAADEAVIDGVEQ